MQTVQWSEILRRIPLEAQNCLLLGMSNGAEIAVQDLLRIDEAFVLIRGRVGGTTDSGRVFCIPYQQVTFCYLSRSLPEQLVGQIFGELLHSIDDQGPLKEGARGAPDELPPEIALEPEPEPEVALPSAAPMRVEPAAPTTIRDRLRARLASSKGAPEAP